MVLTYYRLYVRGLSRGKGDAETIYTDVHRRDRNLIGNPDIYH